MKYLLVDLLQDYAHSFKDEDSLLDALKEHLIQTESNPNLRGEYAKNHCHIFQMNEDGSCRIRLKV